MERMSETSPFDAMEDRILPWSQVKVICGLSRTTVWRMQKTQRPQQAARWTRSQKMA